LPADNPQTIEEMRALRDSIHQRDSIIQLLNDTINLMEAKKQELKNFVNQQ